MVLLQNRTICGSMSMHFLQVFIIMIQFKLRLSDDLHIYLKEAAENAGNSLNAEIVNRLDLTVIKDHESNCIKAGDAKSLTTDSLPYVIKELKDQTFSEIRRCAKLGKLNAYIDLSLFEIEDGDDLLVDTVLEPFIKELRQFGYQIPDSWDLDGFIIEW